MKLSAIILTGVFSGAFLLMAALSPAFAAGVADPGSVREWLDVASDAKIDIRRREYAAQQIIMLADSSASILIAALSGGDGSDSSLRRQVAAKILGELAPPEAEAALLEAAFDEDYFLAEAAEIALARLYAKLPDTELYSLLTKGARERGAIPGGAVAGEEDWVALSLKLAGRRGAFKSLVMRGLALKYAGYAGEGKPLPRPLTWQVWEGLLDADPDLRLASVLMAPYVARPEATERLAAFLYSENNPKILVAALRSMAMMRPPGYGEAVERQAAHTDPLVAIEALAALDAMGYPGVMFPMEPGARTIAGFVTHPSTPVRRRAIELLVAGGNPAALDYLASALFDRIPANRALAARGLGEMGLTAAVGMVSPLLKDDRPEVRREAAVALSKLGVVGIASGVIDELRDRKRPLPFRVAAAEALGRIGDRRAVPALTEASESSEPDAETLRLAALEAIRMLAANE